MARRALVVQETKRGHHTRRGRRCCPSSLLLLRDREEEEMEDEDTADRPEREDHPTTRIDSSTAKIGIGSVKMECVNQSRSTSSCRTEYCVTNRRNSWIPANRNPITVLLVHKLLPLRFDLQYNTVWIKPGT